MALNLQNSTLTLQQIETLSKGGAADQAIAKSYLINHLGNEPAGVTGPGGIAGTLDTGATAIGNALGALPKAANAASSAASSVTDAVSYVVNNAKYAGIWVGLMILALALVLMGLSRNGLKPPMPPAEVAP
jgi:hypothetical protein